MKFIGRVLLACEESATCRESFAKLGWDAWSCDLMPSRIPSDKHYQGDVFDIINDGFDLMVAFPPCTYLTVTANKWFKEMPERKSGKLVGKERLLEREKSIEFFLNLYSANIKHIAIENPVGVMSSRFRKPDQIIQPFWFGDAVAKKTCLWLKNLPLLTYQNNDSLFDNKTTVVPERHITKSGKSYDKFTMINAANIRDMRERSKFRSKTFPGIANAMATQWTEYYLRAKHDN